MIPRTVNDVLTRWVFRPLFEAARAASPSLRSAQRAYRAGLAFRAHAQRWDRAAQEAWMLAAVRRICRHAFDTTVFYRKTWTQLGFDPHEEFGWTDFARLPVLRREHLQAHQAELRSRIARASECRWNATGGSTGRPVEFLMGPLEIGWASSGAEYAMRRIGIPQGLRRAYLWGHHLDPISRDSLMDRTTDLLANRRWYECLRLSDAQLERYDADLRRYRPHCIIAYASALAAFAEYLVRRGGPHPDYPLGAFVTGAEKMFPHQRAVVEQVFGRPVHERYGGRDIGQLGFQYEVPASARFEIDWAWAVVEPETTEESAPILVTKLFGDAMPMIRYANDDEARFPAGSMPGHPAFHLEEVMGRVTDRIAMPSGRWVHGNHFPHLLKAFPLRDYQVVQRSDYSIVVRYVPDPGFGPQHEAAIVQNLGLNLPGIPIALEAVDEIPRTRANKWRPVVSEVRT